MTRFAILAMFCALLALSHGTARDDKAEPAKPGAIKPTRALYRVKHGDAAALADAVGRHYKGEADVIAAGPGGAILVSGSAASVPEVVKLLRQLDRKPRSIEIEIAIADVPAAEWKEGEAGPDQLAKANSVQRVKLSATEGQPVTSTTGGNKPYPTEAVGAKGFVQRSVHYHPVGTTVRLTARVGSEGAVALDLEMEDSRVKPAQAGDAAGAPAMETAVLRTRLNVPAGKAVVARAVRSESKTADTVAVAVVVVSAKVVAADAPPTTKP